MKVQDQQPNFPWGLWNYRYTVDYYGLKKTLSEEDFLPYQELTPWSVQWLNLANTGISDRDLECISGLADLEYLSLANETYASGEVIPDYPQNDITDVGLARLAGLKKLKGIDLRGTAVTDEGLRLLSAMPNLVWIYLDGTEVSDSGLRHLTSHVHLMMLELNGCKIRSPGYQELIQIPGLHSLGLRNTGTTDDDLRLLEENISLGILRLNDTDVTKEAVRQFRLTHPKCIVEY